MANPLSEHVRHRDAPRISANDLARYMVAGETGKIGIIQRSRDASTAATTRYAKVREDIRDYLCDHARTRRSLLALQNKYREMADNPGNTVWSREDARLSVEVLEALAGLENQIAGGKFIPAPRRQVPLMINGVRVSVFLNVLMVRERSNVSEIGGILFRLSKADDETDAAASKRREVGSYAATLALMQIQSHHATDRQPHHALCASFDIQCEDIHWAPRNHATKRREIENACRFIAAMWETA